MMRAALVAGSAVLLLAWSAAALVHGMTGHMTAHMLTVAVAAPLLALGLRGTVLDAAARWPALVQPVQMSLLELFVVWGWHAPAARALAQSSAVAATLEQASFLAAGWLLWTACLGTLDAAHSARRAAAVIALLLTTMHMTLLGVLITLAPRPLYGGHGGAAFGLTPLADQQLGGVLMLLVGSGTYLAAGVWLCARLLHAPAPLGVRS